MAFDFLGSFSKQDLENLRVFLQAELDKVDAQTNHLLLECDKLKSTLGVLISYVESTNNKFKTYRYSFARKTQSQYYDADSAVLVQTIKQPFYQNIKVRERQEYKMKKIIDKIEQLQERVHLLRVMKTEFRLDIEKINALFSSNRRYLTVEEEVNSNVI